MDDIVVSTAPVDHTALVLMLGRVEGKLDLLLITRKETDDRLSGVEARVHNLEKWRAYLVGISTVAGAVLSYLAHKMSFLS